MISPMKHNKSIRICHLSVICAAKLLLFFALFQDTDQFGGFADAVEGTEQGVEIGLAGIEGEGDRAGTEVADDVLDALLKGNILHNLVAATLAMQVAAEEHHLALLWLRLLLLLRLLIGCRAGHCRPYGDGQQCAY